MNTSVVVLMLTVCVGAASYACYRWLFDPLHRFPGPKLWAVTQLPWHVYNIQGRLPFVLERLHAKYGPVVRIGPNEVSVVATERETWRKIYGRKPEMMKNLHGTGPPPSATGVPGIIQADEPDHSRMRRTLLPAFSEKSLRAQEGLFLFHIQRFMAVLERNTGSGKMIDIGKLFNLTTFDIIGDFAFGEPFGGLSSGEYHPWVGTILQQVRAIPIIQLLVHFGIFKHQHLFIPKRFEEQRNQFWAIALDKVEKRLEKGRQGREDLISLLTWDDLDKRELHINAAVITIAGSETSASHLTGVIFFLLQNPDSKLKLQHEVRSSFAGLEDIRIGAVARLQYLACVIQEAFRLYPPAPSTISRVVPLGGETVEGWPLPPGTVVGIPQWSTNRSAINFKDPLNFEPGRWMPSECPPVFKHDHLDVVQPFSYGNRGCLGQSLAELEIRLILCHLLFGFDIEGAPGFESWSEHRAYLSWERKPLEVIIRRSV